MNRKVHELQYNIDQSDRSLYSMLVDLLVGVLFYHKNMKTAELHLAPRTFASEPHGGILTEAWLVVTKILRESDLETLRSKAETLKNSEEITEAIAGSSLLWGISNHEFVRSRRKLPTVVDDSAIEDLFKD